MKTNYFYNAHVINVVDGDTIDVIVDLGFRIKHELRLRLSGIDTPEMNSSNPLEREGARAAKDKVKELVLDKEVMIETFKVDKYGRYLATVFYEGDHSVNDELILEGLAVAYDGGKR